MSGLIMKYFVLKPSGTGVHGKASRAALTTYEHILRLHGEIEFAEDIRLWLATINSKIGLVHKQHE